MAKSDLAKALIKGVVALGGLGVSIVAGGTAKKSFTNAKNDYNRYRGNDQKSK